MFIHMVTIDRFINSFYTSNTYLLSVEGSEEVWLVDCGDYASQVKPQLQGRTVKGVLLTHTHSDHIYGFEELLMDFPEVAICTNDFGSLALGDPKMNVSRYHTEVPDLVIRCEENVVKVGEGDMVELFEGVNAQVLFTPGHDKSCLCYIMDGYLFTGDSYIPGERLIAIFPHSNKKDARESYERLLALASHYTVCPGHGPMTIVSR